MEVFGIIAFSAATSATGLAGYCLYQLTELNKTVENLQKDFEELKNKAKN